MGIFIEHPLLAAVIGILLVALGRIVHRGVATAVGAMWFMYSLWEFGIEQRWLCSGDCAIRVDLLLIYPVLWLGSVAAVASLIMKPRRAQGGS
jgi:hypothetical protein